MNDYDVKMLDAYIQKPQKLEYYKNAFENIDNGKIWNWSWWSFFFGSLFLLYRKAYLGAFAFFILSISVVVLQNAIDIGSSNTGSSNVSFIILLLIWMAHGGLGLFFIYKKYIYIKTKIEKKFQSEANRVASMTKAGGARNAFLIVTLIVLLTFSLSILATIAIPRLAATKDNVEVAKASTELSLIADDISAYYTAYNGYGQIAQMTNVKNISNGFRTKDGEVALYKFKGKFCVQISLNKSSNLLFLDKIQNENSKECKKLYKYSEKFLKQYHIH